MRMGGKHTFGLCLKDFANLPKNFLSFKWWLVYLFISQAVLSLCYCTITWRSPSCTEQWWKCSTKHCSSPQGFRNEAAYGERMDTSPWHTAMETSFPSASKVTLYLLSQHLWQAKEAQRCSIAREKFCLLGLSKRFLRNGLLQETV